MSAATEAVLNRLSGIVGAAYVVADPVSLTGYAVDGLAPSLVAKPGTAEEICEVVRFAAAEKVALIATGARTKLGIGMPPSRYDLAVDMTRLNRVIAYDPGDLTLSVEAGMPLAALAAELAKHKQMLPLAVPFTSTTTVGGAIASGVDSPLRQCYGTVRDYMLGIEFVDGRGALTKSGTRVVKSVAGYDIHKLMVGSLGTLGIVTRVNFRTFPVPPASRGFLASFSDLRGALELRHRIARSPLQPCTLEILSPELAQVFAQRRPRTLGQDLAALGPWFSTKHWTLAAGFGGNQQILARYESELTRLAKDAGATNTIVLGDSDRPLVWGRLRECMPLLLESSPAATIVKISVLPTRLAEMTQLAQQALATARLHNAILLRGVGLIYLAILPEGPAPETLRQVAGVCATVLETAAKLDGHAVIPWCPAELKKQMNIWGPPREDFKLMGKLKATFDPHNILSPGRFVGGI